MHEHDQGALLDRQPVERLLELVPAGHGLAGVGVAGKLGAIRGHTELPVGVGFGVRDAATARAIAQIADAVVVGSRMVQEMENSTTENVAGNLARLTAELRSAIDTN